MFVGGEDPSLSESPSIIVLSQAWIQFCTQAFLGLGVARVSGQVVDTVRPDLQVCRADEFRICSASRWDGLGRREAPFPCCAGGRKSHGVPVETGIGNAHGRLTGPIPTGEDRIGTDSVRAEARRKR